MAGGRPREWDREKLLTDLEDYVNNTEIPIASEFAYLQGMNRQYLYEIPEISDAIKWLMTKKEAQLERKGLNNEVNIGMAIMSLKQMGWKDRPDVNTSETGGLRIVLENKTDDPEYFSNVEINIPAKEKTPE